MVYFARLDETGNVVQVYLLNDEVITDENGNEQEQLGIDFLSDLFGGESWKQSFKDGTRKNPAGIGLAYDEVRDAYIQFKPYDSWILNEDTCRWYAPTEKPDDGKMYTWDEENTQWVEDK